MFNKKLTVENETIAALEYDYIDGYIEVDANNYYLPIKDTIRAGSVYMTNESTMIFYPDFNVLNMYGDNLGKVYKVRAHVLRADNYLRETLYMFTKRIQVLNQVSFEELKKNNYIIPFVHNDDEYERYLMYIGLENHNTIDFIRNKVKTKLSFTNISDSLINHCINDTVDFNLVENRTNFICALAESKVSYDYLVEKFIKAF